MNLFGRKNKSLEPLEIKQKIIGEIDDEIVAVGGGLRKFPHAGVEVRLFAPDEAAKAKYQSAFVENNLLEKAVHDYLQPPRCAEAKPFVKIFFTDDAAEKQAFKLIFAGEETPAVGDKEAYLEVLDGLANVRKMRLSHKQTYIGRCRETRQQDGRIVRKNDLFFLDARELTGKISKDMRENDRVNTSVSRIHAHIELNEKDGNYYLYDDGSRKGTTVLRDGRGLGETVDRRAGKILKDKDVINFGKAKVRFRLSKKD